MKKKYLISQYCILSFLSGINVFGDELNIILDGGASSVIRSKYIANAGDDFFPINSSSLRCLVICVEIFYPIEVTINIHN